MLRRSRFIFCNSSQQPQRQHTKLIIWGTFGAAPAPRLQPTELILTNLPPQSELPSKWNFIACSAGSRHIALLTEEGHIVLIGSNKHGQLGRDTTQNIPENEPQYFDLDYQNPETEKPNAITCGCNYTIAYRRRTSDTDNKTTSSSSSSMRAVVIGYNNAGQLGLGHKEILDNRDGVAEWRPNASWWKKNNSNNNDSNENAVEVEHIECGYNHTFAVLKDGRVFAFGTNQWGELGFGRNITDSPMQPKEVPFFSSSSSSSNFVSNFSDISAGNSFSLFLNKEGKVFACGTAARGQIPFAAQEPLVYPVQRDARPLLMRVCNISCGADHVVLVTRSRNKKKEKEIISRREKLVEEFLKIKKNDNNQQEKYFADLIDPDTGKYKRCYDYEVFFRGSMPDIGIVNATGTMQKVALGEAQPPFQCVKSHASSTILVDRNGDFFGLGANPEGQLGDWTLMLQQQKLKEKKKKQQQQENETTNDKQEETTTSSSSLFLREKEIELFGKEIVETVDKIEQKEIQEEADRNKIVKPEGFGIVFAGAHAENLDHIPSVHDFYSNPHFSSREMPMLAVEELRRIDGLESNSFLLKSKNQKKNKETNDGFDLFSSVNAMTVRYDSKGFSSSSHVDSVVPQWRDRLGLGNGFGILLDPLDEYDVSTIRSTISENNEEDSSSLTTTATSPNKPCYMPKLKKKKSGVNSFTEEERLKKEERLRRKKRRKANLKFW